MQMQKVVCLYFTSLFLLWRNESLKVYYIDALLLTFLKRCPCSSGYLLVHHWDLSARTLQDIARSQLESWPEGLLIIKRRLFLVVLSVEPKMVFLDFSLRSFIVLILHFFFFRLLLRSVDLKIGNLFLVFKITHFSLWLSLFLVVTWLINVYGSHFLRLRFIYVS